MLRIIITVILALLLSYTTAVWALRAPEEPYEVEAVIDTNQVTKPQSERIKRNKKKPTDCRKTNTCTAKDNPNNCNLKTHYMWKDGSCHKKPNEYVAPVARSGTTHGVEQWRSLVAQYNWDVDLVLRIMQCESGGNSNAVNSTPPDYSVGLMQINIYGSLANSRPSESWLKVPENNIKYAYQMSGGGKNFSPWSCYYKI